MTILADHIKWRGDLSFSERPFNVADAMLFSEMAYFPWECIPASEWADKNTIRELIPCLNWKDGTFACREYQMELARLAAQSNRYGDTIVADPVNEVSHKESTQFAAVTFIYGKKQNFISFRGTDSTVAGWKENMALSYEEHIPAQLKSVKYLKEAASKNSGTIVVGGHSKGGNLSIYSVVFSTKAIKKRVRSIFSFDGPGFNELLADNDKFRDVEDRIHTYVPQDSIIGMLLTHKEGYNVIHSYEKGGVKQHLMDSWEVGPDGLVPENGLSKTGEFSSSSLGKWIAGLSFNEKKTFVRIVFGLAEKNNIRSVEELLSVRNLVSVMNAYRKLSKEERNSVTSTLSDLGSSIWGNLKERYVDPVSEIAGKFAGNITGFATLYVNYLEDK